VAVTGGARESAVVAAAALGGVAAAVVVAGGARESAVVSVVTLLGEHLDVCDVRTRAAGLPAVFLASPLPSPLLPPVAVPPPLVLVTAFA
jgi:hypothetical protein